MKCIILQENKALMITVEKPLCSMYYLKKVLSSELKILKNNIINDSDIEFYIGHDK